MKKDLPVLAAIKDSLNCLDKPARINFFLFSMSQIAINFLDLLAVALFGTIGSLTLNGLNESSIKKNNILVIFSLENFDYRVVVALLLIVASLFFIARSILNVVITKKSFNFWSKIAARLSANLFQLTLSDASFGGKKISREDKIITLTRSINSQINGVLGASVTLISDLSLVIILVLGLVLIDLKIAFMLLAILGFSTFILYLKTSKQIAMLTSEDLHLSIKSNQLISDFSSVNDEIYLRGSSKEISKKFHNTRSELGKVLARLNYLPIFSKSAIEVILIISCLAVVFITVSLYDAASSATFIAAFLATGFRLAPSLMRLQQSSATIRANAKMAERVSLLRLSLSNPLNAIENIATGVPDDFGIVFNSFGISLGTTSRYLIKDFSLTIPEARFVLITGLSGAGKSTLLKSMLGFSDISSGEITIGGMNNVEYIRSHPGSVGYVPQFPHIINNTLRENLLLGAPIDQYPDELLNDVLERFHFSNHDLFNEGLDTWIGNDGTRLSGGESQKIALARAILTKPNILILDEFTSALDSDSEAQMFNILDSLRTHVTILLVSHKLPFSILPDIRLNFEDRAIEVEYFDSH